MASVFKKEEIVQKKKVIEIIYDSLDVDSEGTVRFRSRIGRGSGKAIEIPGEEFDKFVTFMIKTKDRREILAKQQRILESVATVSVATTENENVSEIK